MNFKCIVTKKIKPKKKKNSNFLSFFQCKGTHVFYELNALLNNKFQNIL